MLADDRSPGRSVIDTDPLTGHSAYFGVLRVNRELGKNNSIGFIYTDRELHTDPNTFCGALRCVVGFNRVGGVDTQIRINQNWQFNAQAVTSETKFSDGTHQSGPAYHAAIERSTRAWEYNAQFEDISAGFDSETGFINRNDIRRVNTLVARTFHPEGKLLTAHGPRLFEQSLWDHNGTGLDHLLNPAYEWDFPGNSAFSIFSVWEHELLRPQDFSTLAANRDYPHLVGGAQINTQYYKWLNLSMEMDWGTATNFVPRTGPPVLAYQNTAFVKATVRPTKGLTIENTYLMTRLLDQDTKLNIFNNHIMRSKWNYQFTKEFSLRLIGEYDTTISNSSLTTLQNTKGFNGDVLFTYLLTPGTAIYAGYNSDLQNLDPRLERICAGLPCAPGQGFDGLLRTRNNFINDGRQIFIKLSYLFRY
jgi:hypothetical protein